MPTKKDKIEALRLARPLIEDGREIAVCVALMTVSHANPYLIDACWDVRLRIERAIGRGYVSNWLYRQAGVPDHLLTEANMREYRLHWIDSMIAELEAT